MSAWLDTVILFTNAAMCALVALFAALMVGLLAVAKESEMTIQRVTRLEKLTGFGRFRGHK